MSEDSDIDYTIKVGFHLFDVYESNRIEEVDSFTTIVEEKLPISNTIRTQEQLNELIFGNSEMQDGSEAEINDNDTTRLMMAMVFDTVDDFMYTDERLEGYIDRGTDGRETNNNIHLDYANKTIDIIANYFKYLNRNNNTNTYNYNYNIIHRNRTNNNNNNNNLNNKLITKRNNNNNNNNNNNSKNITNTITGNIIENGNIIGNFHNESAAKRYYKKNTVKRLLERRPSTNPYTRAPLKRENVTYYKARLPNQNGGLCRRHTRRRRAQKRRTVARRQRRQSTQRRRK